MLYLRLLTGLLIWFQRLRMVHALTAADDGCNLFFCMNMTINNDIMTFEVTPIFEPFGWVGLGFGPRMKDTPMIVVWEDDKGSPILSQRYGVGHVEPVIEDYPQRVASMIPPTVDLVCCSLRSLSQSYGSLAAEEQLLHYSLQGPREQDRDEPRPTHLGVLSAQTRLGPTGRSDGPLRRGEAEHEAEQARARLFEPRETNARNGRIRRGHVRSATTGTETYLARHIFVAWVPRLAPYGLSGRQMGSHLYASVVQGSPPDQLWHRAPRHRVRLYPWSPRGIQPPSAPFCRRASDLRRTVVRSVYRTTLSWAVYPREETSHPGPRTAPAVQHPARPARYFDRSVRVLPGSQRLQRVVQEHRAAICLELVPRLVLRLGPDPPDHVSRRTRAPSAPIRAGEAGLDVWLASDEELYRPCG